MLITLFSVFGGIALGFDGHGWKRLVALVLAFGGFGIMTQIAIHYGLYPRVYSIANDVLKKHEQLYHDKGQRPEEGKKI
jgi:hypothetical protein